CSSQVLKDLSQSSSLHTLQNSLRCSSVSVGWLFYANHPACQQFFCFFSNLFAWIGRFIQTRLTAEHRWVCHNSEVSGFVLAHFVKKPVKCFNFRQCVYKNHSKSNNYLLIMSRCFTVVAGRSAIEAGWDVVDASVVDVGRRHEYLLLGLERRGSFFRRVES
ncbi:MAG: hypothetical protein RLY58_473, partial [Pseudomonadota bacterium]